MPLDHMGFDWAEHWWSPLKVVCIVLKVCLKYMNFIEISSISKKHART
jgi:hypothetical protein